jgi:hypothetical protein
MHLVGWDMMSFTAFLSHTMGHTHNRLDQLYGVVARAFASLSRIEDIWGIAREIEACLRRPALEAWFNGAEVHVEVIDSVRNWKEYFAQADVTFSGAMLSDAKSMHAWMFLKRRDLSPAMSVEHPTGRSSMRFVAHPDDVVLVVKHYVWQATMPQPPLLVLPHARRLLAGPLPVALRPPNEPKHPTEWIEYADIIVQLWPDNERYWRAAQCPSGKVSGEFCCLSA